MGIIESNMKKALGKMKLLGMEPDYIGNFYFSRRLPNNLAEIHRFFEDGDIISGIYQPFDMNKHFLLCGTCNDFEVQLFLRNIKEDVRGKYDIGVLGKIKDEDTKVIMCHKSKYNTAILSYTGKCIGVYNPWLSKHSTFYIIDNKAKPGMYKLVLNDGSIYQNRIIIEFDDKLENISNGAYAATTVCTF